ncbi:tubulin polyglutamylase TTLL6-like [Neocloeon triangulifer]|uniref:tubulin polyglutamylase TTLL6-like n=1 Tax=Neocloeon triangulifer TaxID=2078957 RepID=UPI00286EEB07|nr:tubulin polyglutamylase TTLL6-like [Neocloeon triangulifer]
MWKGWPKSSAQPAQRLPNSKVQDTTTSKPPRKRSFRKPSICIMANQAIVKKAADRLELVEVGENSAWNVLWTDQPITVQQCLSMERFQMVNYIPGISEITRKDLLARNLTRMQKMFPEDYDFFPKTWWLPADLKELTLFSRQNRGSVYIVKPGSSSQGRGIFITKCLGELESLQQFVCQAYIARPLLIDGFKFDMRIYGLITTCDPLRLYLYNEGIARFATQKYEVPGNNNLHNVFMHLTNYSINKHSCEFVSGEDGSKRRISTINAWMQTQGFDVGLIWNTIDDAIIKTVIPASENLKRQYKMSFPRHPQGCFVLLGFDVLLDADLKPHILEVNRCPSLNIDSPMDEEVKEQLLVDIFTLLNLGRLDQHRVKDQERKRLFESNQLTIKKIAQKVANAPQKENDEDDSKIQADALEACLRAQVEWEEQNLGNFRIAYPNVNSEEKYSKFFSAADVNSSLFQETVASKARKAMVLKSLQVVEEEIAPAFEDFSLKEEEIKLNGSTVSRGRITALNSFEPSFINLAEERERVREMDKRDFLVQSFNLRAYIVEAMRQNGLLRQLEIEEPRKLEKSKFAVLPKIQPDFMPFEAGFHHF